MMTPEKDSLIDEIQSKQEEITQIEESWILTEVYKEYTDKLTNATVAIRNSIDNQNLDYKLTEQEISNLDTLIAAVNELRKGEQNEEAKNSLSILLINMLVHSRKIWVVTQEKAISILKKFDLLQELQFNDEDYVAMFEKKKPEVTYAYNADVTRKSSEVRNADWTITNITENTVSVEGWVQIGKTTAIVWWGEIIKREGGGNVENELTAQVRATHVGENWSSEWWVTYTKVENDEMSRETAAVDAKAVRGATIFTLGWTHTVLEEQVPSVTPHAQAQQDNAVADVLTPPPTGRKTVTTTVKVGISWGTPWREWPDLSKLN